MSSKPFTWERGLFERCPKCQENTLGFLSAGPDVMTLRCTACRYSHGELLPLVNKVVIYLDQFVFSTIFKMKGGGRAPLGQKAFYDELVPLLRRVMLLQQAICPHSDLHNNETLVFRDARGLGDALESIGGGGSFKNSCDLKQEQVFDFARAYRDGVEPSLRLEPDDALMGERNGWLRDMRISVNTDYSRFAEEMRQQRDQTFESLKGLVAHWIAEKPTFAQMLRRELQFGVHRRTGVTSAMMRLARADQQGDGMAYINASLDPVWREYIILNDFFLKEGGTEEEAMRKVQEFWDWQKLKDLPHHRITAYLFAAFGRRIVAGQRKFTRGLMTDFQSVATYAPYVDAMFLDKECANLLGDGELKTNLQYRAEIFSYANADEFLDYLRALEAQAPAEVRAYASRIYGNL